MSKKYVYLFTEGDASMRELLGGKGILKFIKDLVLKSYGVRSADGKRIMKVDETGRPLSIEFSQTMAFEAILDEFLSDDIAASNFVNAVIPANVADKMPKGGKAALPASK